MGRNRNSQRGISVNQRTTVPLTQNPLLASTELDDYNDIVKVISSASPRDVDELIQYQLSLPVVQDWRDRSIPEMNPQVLQALALYSPTVEQRTAVIRFLKEQEYRSRLGNIKAFVLRKSPDAWILDGEEKFMEQFWNAWRGSEFLPRSVWGQLQEYFSMVGGNRNHAAPKDFYPKGVTPPQLNPAIIQALQNEYERTQRLLAESGYPEDGITLYRGTTQPAGLGLESWTDLPEISEIFAHGIRFSGGDMRVKGEVRVHQVPRKAIFGSWQTIPNWDEDLVAGKHEYMVLGTSLFPAKRPPAQSRTERESLYNRVGQSELNAMEVFLNT